MISRAEEQMREAEAVPQLGGKMRPGGSVLYVCAGTSEFGKPCGKLLGVWVSPQNGSRAEDHGHFEIKCRRCKTLNRVPLDVKF